jgi:hypothetical protein
VDGLHEVRYIFSQSVPGTEGTLLFLGTKSVSQFILQEVFCFIIEAFFPEIVLAHLFADVFSVCIGVLLCQHHDRG